MTTGDMHMLREALVIVPKADNNGNSLDHVLHEASRRACLNFGGCTVREAVGSWVSPDGTLYREPVWEVTMAGASNLRNSIALMELAEYVGQAGQQLSVYVRDFEGAVSLVDIALPPAAAIAA